MSEKLTIEVLETAVKTGAALRTRTRLQPAGGVGDKVFPPTYSIERGLKYAIEIRRIDGADVETVLLDSVASQANRMEEALFDAWDDELISFPVLSVDFSEEDDIADIGMISALHAPHRYADALLRDAIDKEGTPFRKTAIGEALTEASPRSATAVYQYCPTALVFGCWDSTGPKGGLGSKFQRCLVSEIVGIGMRAGVKVGSRLDPAGIQSNVEIYPRKDDDTDWTTNPDEAKIKKGKPILFNRSGGEGKGKPSAINHGNIAPSVDKDAGGVTIDYAEQTIVLSMPALRRLRMATGYDGAALESSIRKAAGFATHLSLAALALAGVVAQRQRGYDLRSRCALVPDPAGPMSFEFVSTDGEIVGTYDLGWKDACALMIAAQARAADVGFGWEREPLRLKPAPKLAGLIRESRARAATSESGEAD